MPRLEDKMAKVSEQAAENLPDSALEVMQGHTKELQRRGLADEAVGGGDRAPEFPLLADAGNRVADGYGLVYQCPPDLRDVYRDDFGVDLAEYNGDDSWTLPMPARYVVDAEGRIRWASVSADYSRRPDPADTLEAVRRLAGG